MKQFRKFKIAGINPFVNFIDEYGRQLRVASISGAVEKIREFRKDYQEGKLNKGDLAFLRTGDETVEISYKGTPIFVCKGHNGRVEFPYFQKLIEKKLEKVTSKTQLRKLYEKLAVHYSGKEGYYKHTAPGDLTFLSKEQNEWLHRTILQAVIGEVE